MASLQDSSLQRSSLLGCFHSLDSSRNHTSSPGTSGASHVAVSMGFGQFCCHNLLQPLNSALNSAAAHSKHSCNTAREGCSTSLGQEDAEHPYNAYNMPNQTVMRFFSDILLPCSSWPAVRPPAGKILLTLDLSVQHQFGSIIRQINKIRFFEDVWSLHVSSAELYPVAVPHGVRSTWVG
jgi:hypothetical protein